jgi:Tfp pilus assembly protein PilV
MKKVFYKKGIGLVEVLVAVFIFTIILSSLILISNMYLSGATDSLRNTQAAYLAEEGIEGIKVIRDNSWDSILSIPLNTKSYLSFSTASSTWQISNTEENIGVFSRSFIVNSVNRDSNGDISGSGTNDPNTKKVMVTISWNGKNGAVTKDLITYITNIVSD